MSGKTKAPETQAIEANSSSRANKDTAKQLACVEDYGNTSNNFLKNYKFNAAIFPELSETQQEQIS
jgi:hypothetical protein